MSCVSVVSLLVLSSCILKEKRNFVCTLQLTVLLLVNQVNYIFFAMMTMSVLRNAWSSGVIENGMYNFIIETNM